MTAGSLVPIEYRGTLVAVVSADRVHVVSPWLASRPAGDPDLRFVLYMCLCLGEVLGGRFGGPFSCELAARWARAGLIDRDLLAATEPAADETLASRWNVPLDQLKLAREELGE